MLSFQQQWQEFPSSKKPGLSQQALARAGGPISLLQEYVQSDRRFPSISNRPILSWMFDTRMATAVKLEFRATVSFLLAGVPHHASGSWYSSKKAAQRDAAERVLEFLYGQWDDFSASGRSKAVHVACTPESLASERLAQFCFSLAPTCADGAPLTWRCSRSSSSEGWQAAVDITVFDGTVHTLQGDVCDDPAAAREDTALRALWYLQCPGYEDAFRVSEDAVTSETLALPSDSAWQREGAERDMVSESQQRAAGQKTIIMRLQNRLQRLFAKKLPQNTSVWDWSFEYSDSSNDGDLGTIPIPLCRARVRLALVDREFAGQWCHGQKAAQFDVCNSVEAFLDSGEASAMLNDEQASRL